MEDSEWNYDGTSYGNGMVPKPRKNDFDSDLDPAELYLTESSREKMASNYSKNELEFLKSTFVEESEKGRMITPWYADKEGGWFSKIPPHVWNVIELNLFFQTNVPKDPSEWKQSHPIIHEIRACISPIIIAKSSLSMQNLREEMQHSGAFLMGVQSGKTHHQWIMRFIITNRFYCDVSMFNANGVPNDVLEIEANDSLDEEPQKIIADITDYEQRTALLKEERDKVLIRGILTEEAERAEMEDTILTMREARAKNGSFKTPAGHGTVIGYDFVTFGF